jgi:hypothetical protein
VLTFLEEGRSFIEKSPVQASEKLYKAAEESVELLALHPGVSARASPPASSRSP